MVHTKKKREKAQRQKGKALGKRDREELARARAKRRGKIAVVSEEKPGIGPFGRETTGGPIITEKTPTQIEAERRFDISKEVDKLELQERIDRQRDEGPIQSFPLEEKEKGFFEKVGDLAGKFD